MSKVMKAHTVNQITLNKTIVILKAIIFYPSQYPKQSSCIIGILVYRRIEYIAIGNLLFNVLL